MRVRHRNGIKDAIIEQYVGGKVDNEIEVDSRKKKILFLKMAERKQKTFWNTRDISSHAFS